MSVTLGMILEARERLKGVAQRTGLVQFKALSEVLWAVDTYSFSFFSGALGSWSLYGCLEPSSDKQNRG